MMLEFYLKTGKMFKGRVTDDYKFGPGDLTADTVHKIVAPGGKSFVFVQGDNISHVINRGETN